MSPVKSGLLIIAAAAALSACLKKGSVEETGVYTIRSTCPQLGIPAGTGDITLFAPPGRTDAAAIDVVATITNLRGQCSEDSANVVSTATFDVVATRRDAGEAEHGHAIEHQERAGDLHELLEARVDGKRRDGGNGLNGGRGKCGTAVTS